MTTSCAQCGCRGTRSNRVRTCATGECCCEDSPLQTMDAVAKRVRHAMEHVDLVEMGALLAPDARWGAPEQDVPTCRNAQQILSWYEMARDNGVRADVTDVTVVGERLVIGLKILAAADGSKDSVRWQVLCVDDGLITEIRGYEHRGDAMTFATSGRSNWTPSPPSQ